MRKKIVLLQQSLVSQRSFLKGNELLPMALLFFSSYGDFQPLLNVLRGNSRKVQTQFSIMQYNGALLHVAVDHGHLEAIKEISTKLVVETPYKVKAMEMALYDSKSEILSYFLQKEATPKILSHLVKKLTHRVPDQNIALLVRHPITPIHELIPLLEKGLRVSYFKRTDRFIRLLENSGKLPLLLAHIQQLSQRPDWKDVRIPQIDALITKDLLSSEFKDYKSFSEAVYIKALRQFESDLERPIFEKYLSWATKAYPKFLENQYSTLKAMEQRGWEVPGLKDVREPP
jgi:hypothetical protein